MKLTSLSPAAVPRMAFDKEVTLPRIRLYARQIAEQFHPDKIILFGSHAYGTQNENSDVDLLVVMEARNQHSQAIEIRWQLPAPFPMDLLVRTPEFLNRRLCMGDSFVKEIDAMGKVLYEKHDEAMDRKGGKRSNRSAKVPGRQRSPA